MVSMIQCRYVSHAHRHRTANTNIFTRTPMPLSLRRSYIVSLQKTTLEFAHACVFGRAVVLLFVNGKQPAPPDLVHSIYEERKTCKKNVNTYLSQRRAQLQRKVIQKRDQDFHSHHPKRFRNTVRKSGGSTLLVNGSPNTDCTTVLSVWSDHFSKLGTSQVSSNHSLQEISESIPNIELATLEEYDNILDTPFLPEEVVAAINHLKRSSSAGPDSLSPQHLIYAGPLLKSWLCKVFNAIANLEVIPSQFKEGTIIPIYKGKGKDPLLPGSYRGINNPYLGHFQNL